MIAQALDKAVKAVAPIHGVSIGKKNVKSTWRIDFKDEATQAEKDAAQLVIDNFKIADVVVAEALQKKKDTAVRAIQKSRDEAELEISMLPEAVIYRDAR